MKLTQLSPWVFGTDCSQDIHTDVTMALGYGFRSGAGLGTCRCMSRPCSLARTHEEVYAITNRNHISENTVYASQGFILHLLLCSTGRKIPELRADAGAQLRDRTSRSNAIIRAGVEQIDAVSATARPR